MKTLPVDLFPRKKCILKNNDPSLAEVLFIQMPIIIGSEGKLGTRPRRSNFFHFPQLDIMGS